MSSVFNLQTILPFMVATFLLPGSAHAANDCSVDLANISFGGINVLTGMSVDSVGGPIIVSCTGDPGTVNVSIGLDEGAGSGATEATRYMKLTGNPTYQLAYSLYSSSANRTSNTYWGSSGASLYTSTVTVSNNSGSTSIDVYGRVFGYQQSAMAGSYGDILNITVSY